jgi:predicted permease
MLYMNGVGPRFFETLEMPLVAGRAPTFDDDTTRPAVVVVNQTAAERYFGSDSPIGRRFKLGPRDVEVIGVAADSKYYHLRAAAEPTVFDPYLQRAAGRNMYVVMRVASNLGAVEADVRKAVAEIAPRAPVSEMRTQNDYIARITGRERLLARLLSVFGAFALVLACVGLYGATAYAVARRTSEIGVRVALGARRSQVVWLMLRSVLALTAIGVLLGGTAAFWTGRLVGSFLFDLEPYDPATILIAAGAMVLVSLIAGIIPARRAARMEPRTALRAE